MRTIFKFDVEVRDGEQVIPFPLGEKLLHVASQHDPGSVQLWYEVNDDYPVVDHRFLVVPTGGEIPDYFVHRGTALAFGGALVWHVYEWEPF